MTLLLPVGLKLKAPTAPLNASTNYTEDFEFDVELEEEKVLHASLFNT